MVGTRVSLFIGIVATFFDLTIGVFYGIISGWRGGMTDTLMQRVIEIISSIPNLVVVILILLVFRPGLTSIILAIAFTGWVTMARHIRAQTLQLKDQEFVLAARTLGESSIKIAFKHLIPNLVQRLSFKRCSPFRQRSSLKPPELCRDQSASTDC